MRPELRHGSPSPIYLHNAAPLQPFLDRADVTELVINEPGWIGVETRDGWEWHEAPSLTHSSLMTLAKLIAGLTKQDISSDYPICSSVLPGGERAQVVMPPAVEPGFVSITIRKASNVSMDLAGLERSGLFSEVKAQGIVNDVDTALLGCRDAGNWAEFFRLAVEARKNILISGATGSGKTTFSKALIKLIPDYERVLTIEDTRELVVPHRNRVHMIYSKDGQSLQKAGAKELLESALRMRPDRILLQELRDGTAFFYLRNVNSGHPGSITTIHANTAEGALEQLTLLVKESEGGNDLDRHDIRALLRALVDIVVQMHRVPPGDGKPARYRMSEVWFEPERNPLS
ncbi:P-type DNA transfer ATPase VirB11 [Novosphingobium sp. KN65.2]|uniref:P-type DNA transfer ATPase VirB11 n=1 Tax=Novosphingobium sp. KN65.2 TaxID=1478134 RepID=UPI0005E23592|nr:P-type DNA transfer ATPase VirB11 [Novosphingobium sp. KN65.2]CDO37979.1 Type IV secretion system protein virB11 [Novosphingobium sp. KN65.2]